jgi:2-(1,2-epoxy-1,2-dihydrophenyl)acetyl-CoA isomerase
VAYEVAGSVATVTMTTVSLGVAAKRALLRAVEHAAADDEVRALVLTGTGRVFTAGQDLAEHAAALREPAGDPFATLAEHYNPIVVTLASMPKPVLAAINGTCAGAGLGIALACDLRLAAAGARFTTAFTSIGLAPDSGLSASLSRAIGTARASELILLAEPFTAEDALSWGLIGRVVPAGELATVARELAARLAAGPTEAYATAKRSIRQAWGAAWPDVLDAERRDQSTLGATSDHRDAVEAFLDKRAPRFTGGGPDVRLARSSGETGS